jgi:hypothetical protein
MPFDISTDTPDPPCAKAAVEIEYWWDKSAVVICGPKLNPPPPASPDNSSSVDILRRL